MAGVGFVEALEFGLHVAHVGLPGDHAVFVCVHEKEELLDVIFAESEGILRLGSRSFLRGGGGEESESGESEGGDENEPGLKRMVRHGELLGVEIPDEGNVQR